MSVGHTSARENDTEKFEDLGLCPCGQSIGANTETGSVVHWFPPCKKFLELDPLEFLTYVRISRN